MSNDYRATNYKNFRFWCQKVLPLVYDDSLSYYEILCKVVDYLNNMMKDLNLTTETVFGLVGEFDDVKEIVEQLIELPFQDYINEWLDEHPEATTTVQDHSIDQVKLTENLLNKVMNGFEFDQKTVIHKRKFSTTLTENSNIVTQQGSAYNSIKDTFLIAYINNNSADTVMLVEISISGEDVTVLRRALYSNGELGHANDITYNPRTNKYYVITTVDNAETCALAVVNPETLNIENNITLDLGDGYDDINWTIAYDDVNNVYYSTSHSNIRCYDNNFTLTKVMPFDDQNGVEGFTTFKPIIQCACMYKGLLAIAVVFYYQSPSSAKIVLHNTEDGRVVCSFSYLSQFVREELEGMSVRNDVLYGICGGDESFSIQQFSFNDVIATPAAMSLFKAGQHIPVNSNLDDFINVGKYCCDNTAEARTLTNVPFNHAGFSLYVINNSVSYAFQIAIANVSVPIIYMREYNSDTNRWLPWYSISNVYTPGPTRNYSIKGTYAGYLTLDKRHIGVSINLPNNLSQINRNNIAFAGTFQFYTNAGYAINPVNNSRTFDRNDLTVQIDTLNDHNINLIIYKPANDAFTFESGSGTNNSPVTMAVDLTMTVASA